MKSFFVVAVCFLLVGCGQSRNLKVLNEFATSEIHPILEHNPAYANILVGVSTGQRIVFQGTVASEKILLDFKNKIKSLPLPAEVIWGVTIKSECAFEHKKDTATPWNDGLPNFKTVDDAITYVVDEANISKYKGPVGGSEQFDILLPSGKTTNWWLIDCYFRIAFRKFGKDAYPQLSKLRKHEHEFVRLGAGEVLQHLENIHDDLPGDAKVKEVGEGGE